MFNSDIFANRPPFGIVGRIFISTDTSQIFRDTGTSYVLISDTSGGGTITGSGTTGTLPLWSGSTSLGDSLITQAASVLTAAAKTLISNTNTQISALNPSALLVNTLNTFNGGITWPSLEPCDNVEFLQNNSYNGNITFLNSNYTANHLIVSSFTFLVPGTTITSNQNTGIRAISNQTLQATINGTNNGTITHFANSQVYGDFAGSSARFNFTNRYGYLVNDLDEYGAGHTYTNRYAFYNQGANDHNHFAGKMLLNTLVVTSHQLSVVGTTNLNGALTGTSSITGLSISSSNGNITANGSEPYLIAAGTTNNSFRGLRIFGQSDGLTSFAFSMANFTTGEYRHSSGFATYGGIQTFYTNDLERIRITSGGNVGINTNQPSHTLDVNGTGRLSTSLYVGASTINASAQLEADSTTKGFLPPRMTTTQINSIAAPAEGLVAFNTTISHLCVYQAGAWAKLSHSPM